MGLSKGTQSTQENSPELDKVDSTLSESLCLVRCSRWVHICAATSQGTCTFATWVSEACFTLAFAPLQQLNSLEHELGALHERTRVDWVLKTKDPIQHSAMMHKNGRRPPVPDFAVVWYSCKVCGQMKQMCQVAQDCDIHINHDDAIPLLLFPHSYLHPIQCIPASSHMAVDVGYMHHLQTFVPYRNHARWDSACYMACVRLVCHAFSGCRLHGPADLPTTMQSCSWQRMHG